MNQHTRCALRPRRSFNFTPGLRPDMFPKALASGSDIVCVELEDGIAPRDKTAAREKALALFATPQAVTGSSAYCGSTRCASGSAQRMCRRFLAAELPPPALMMPKVRTTDEVVMLDQLLTEAGHATRLHVIVETNEGLEAAFDIAACIPRFDALFFGGVDMAAELLCQNSFDSMIYARSRVVHAAAAAGFDGIDVPFLDLEDPEDMRAEAEKVHNLGFAGKGAIHPKQIAALNEVFTPDNLRSDRDVARERRSEGPLADRGGSSTASVGIGSTRSAFHEDRDLYWAQVDRGYPSEVDTFLG